MIETREHAYILSASGHHEESGPRARCAPSLHGTLASESAGIRPSPGGKWRNAPRMEGESDPAHDRVLVEAARATSLVQTPLCIDSYDQIHSRCAWWANGHLPEPMTWVPFLSTRHRFNFYRDGYGSTEKTVMPRRVQSCVVPQKIKQTPSCGYGEQPP